MHNSAMATDLLAFFLATLVIQSCSCFQTDLPSPTLSERPPCNASFPTLKDLQAVINRNETHPQIADSENVLCVNLQPGSVEYIDYSLLDIESMSLVITAESAGNGSTRRAPVIMCEPRSANSSDLSPSDYPLTVTNSSLVVIEGVHFVGCMRPLQLNQVTRVEIVSSQFRYIHLLCTCIIATIFLRWLTSLNSLFYRHFQPGGAIDIFKCAQVIVSGCTFSNNTNLGLENRPYSGNAGAVAIGYDETTDQNYQPDIKIIDTTIEYNRAPADGAFDYERDASLFLKRKIFKQRGGGIAFNLGTTNKSADVDIIRCSFEGNFARSAGGGIYINLQGTNNSHAIDIRECNFTNNEALIGAGLATFYNPATSEGSILAEVVALVYIVSITNCVFTGNSGQFGGALSNIQLGYLNELNVTNCTFRENEGSLGAALYLQFLFTTFSFVPEKRIIVEDW